MKLRSSCHSLKQQAPLGSGLPHYLGPSSTWSHSIFYLRSNLHCSGHCLILRILYTYTSAKASHGLVSYPASRSPPGLLASMAAASSGQPTLLCQHHVDDDAKEDEDGGKKGREEKRTTRTTTARTVRSRLLFEAAATSPDRLETRRRRNAACANKSRIRSDERRCFGRFAAMQVYDPPFVLTFIDCPSRGKTFCLSNQRIYLNSRLVGILAGKPFMLFPHSPGPKAREKRGNKQRDQGAAGNGLVSLSHTGFFTFKKVIS